MIRSKLDRLNMNLIKLLVKIEDFLKIVFPNISVEFTLVLLTISISATFGILQAIIIFFKNKNVLESFYLFIYSFLGCFSGGVLGSILGAFLGIVFAAFTPAGDGLMGGLSGIGVADTFMNTIVISWFVGILTAGLITAIPLIESFNNQ